jgi:hypothetical protein
MKPLLEGSIDVAKKNKGSVSRKLNLETKEDFKQASTLWQGTLKELESSFYK